MLQYITGAEAAKNAIVINIGVSDYDNLASPKVDGQAELKAVNVMLSKYKCFNSERIYDNEDESNFEASDFWDIIRDARTSLTDKKSNGTTDFLIIFFSGYSTSDSLIFSDYNGFDEGEVSLKDIQSHFDGKNVPNDFRDCAKLICLSSRRNGNKFNVNNNSHFFSLLSPQIDDIKNKNTPNNFKRKPPPKNDNDNDDEKSPKNSKGGVDGMKKNENQQISSDPLMHFLMNGKPLNMHYNILKQKGYTSYHKIKTITKNDLNKYIPVPPHRKLLLRRIKNY